MKDRVRTLRDKKRRYPNCQDRDCNRSASQSHQGKSWGKLLCAHVTRSAGRTGARPTAMTSCGPKGAKSARRDFCHSPLAKKSTWVKRSYGHGPKTRPRSTFAAHCRRPDAPNVDPGRVFSHPEIHDLGFLPRCASKTRPGLTFDALRGGCGAANVDLGRVSARALRPEVNSLAIVFPGAPKVHAIKRGVPQAVASGKAKVTNVARCWHCFVDVNKSTHCRRPKVTERQRLRSGEG